MENVECAKCGSVNNYSTLEQTFTDGSTHIKATCKDCGKFIKWLPQSETKTYIPFGKYRGKHTYQVTDTEYLQWLWKVVGDKRLANGIDKRIRELTGGCGNG